MGILTRVREHRRRNAPHVSEHLRGSGSRTTAFEGEYQTTKHKDGSLSAKLSIRRRLEKLKADQANFVSQKKQDKQLTESIYAEEKAKIAREKAALRLQQLEANARLRAREGGTFRRGFKSLLGKAGEEAKKALESAKAEEKRTRKMRRKAGGL